MKVFDHEITELQYAAAVARMQTGEFKAADVMTALEEAGRLGTSSLMATRFISRVARLIESSSSSENSGRSACSAALAGSGLLADDRPGSP